MNMTKISESKALRMARSYCALRVPDEWAAHHGLELGQNVYMTGCLDGSIEIHTEQRQWSKSVMLRLKDGRTPILTIPSELAQTRGIDAGDRLEFYVDDETHSLWIRRVV